MLSTLYCQSFQIGFFYLLSVSASNINSLDVFSGSVGVRFYILLYITSVWILFNSLFMLVDKDLSDKHILKNAHVYATSVTSYKGKYSENIPMFKAKNQYFLVRRGKGGKNWQMWKSVSIKYFLNHFIWMPLSTFIVIWIFFYFHILYLC